MIDTDQITDLCDDIDRWVDYECAGACNPWPPARTSCSAACARW